MRFYKLFNNFKFNIDRSSKFLVFRTCFSLDPRRGILWGEIFQFDREDGRLSYKHSFGFIGIWVG